MSYLPIPDHGLIGDLHTAGLVSREGRLVWLPWARFDSPTLFAAILDDQRGGDWLLAPAGAGLGTQRYAGNSALLITDWELEHGRAELHDWMSPWEGEAPGIDLCRVLRCTAGEIDVVCRFAPRIAYATQTADLQRTDDGLRFEAHGMEVFLSASHPLMIEADVATAHITLRAGEELRYVLSAGQHVTLDRIDEDRTRTLAFWETWIERCHNMPPWQALIARSAITLKLLTYAPSGAIIAAPTTSLPEWIGGVRNWDYRYTWIRDAAFTIHALHRLGFRSEASAFFTWLNRRCAQHPAPRRLMYGVCGEVELVEKELEHLEGYRGSGPVRIGNGAYTQHQLDVYGHLLDAIWVYEQHDNFFSPENWADLRAEVEYVCAHWQEPDNGIWEMRDDPAHHTYSKLMCWVALDRALKLAVNEGWPYPRQRWETVRETIRADILAHGWHPEVGAFTQSYGSPALDASLLVMPTCGFLPPDDPRVVATVERIQQQLAIGPLVYRYRTGDGLPGGEGAFLICSFWLVDALVAIGRHEEALRNFEQLIAYAGPLGLLAEEIDPHTGTALGNYPQAFSHIGLLNSALTLAGLGLMQLEQRS